MRTATPAHARKRLEWAGYTDRFRAYAALADAAFPAPAVVTATGHGKDSNIADFLTLQAEELITVHYLGRELPCCAEIRLTPLGTSVASSLGV